MKLLPWLVGLALLVLAGAGWLKWIHDPQVRQLAALERSRDSLDGVVGQLRADSAAHATLDRQREDSIAVKLARAAENHHNPRTDTTAHRADSLAQLAREAVKDSAAMVAVDVALAAKDLLLAQVRQDCAGEINRIRGELLGVIALQRLQIASRDGDLGTLRIALGAAIEQRDAWRRQARPPLLLRILRELPKVVVLGGGGYVIGRAR